MGSGGNPVAIGAVRPRVGCSSLLILRSPGSPAAPWPPSSPSPSMVAPGSIARPADASAAPRSPSPGSTEARGERQHVGRTAADLAPARLDRASQGQAASRAAMGEMRVPIDIRQNGRCFHGAQIADDGQKGA